MVPDAIREEVLPQTLDGVMMTDIKENVLNPYST